MWDAYRIPIEWMERRKFIDTFQGKYLRESYWRIDLNIFSTLTIERHKHPHVLQSIENSILSFEWFSEVSTRSECLCEKWTKSESICSASRVSHLASRIPHFTMKISIFVKIIFPMKSYNNNAVNGRTHERTQNERGAKHPLQ